METISTLGAIAMTASSASGFLIQPANVSAPHSRITVASAPTGTKIPAATRTIRRTSRSRPQAVASATILESAAGRPTVEITSIAV